jgi:phosphotriesterase-related protein
LKKLVDDGYERQILLANDVCLKVLLHSYGGWGYDHVMTNIVPMMRAEGISQDAIERIIKLNPISFLSGNRKISSADFMARE